ncbi:MAG: hypothetical protein AAGD09_23420 [Cyanobacteria bacterium P01_F01_bin.56]
MQLAKAQVSLSQYLLRAPLRPVFLIQDAFIIVPTRIGMTEYQDFAV